MSAIPIGVRDYSQLADVNITSSASGVIAFWNSTTSKWDVSGTGLRIVPNASVANGCNTNNGYSGNSIASDNIGGVIGGGGSSGSENILLATIPARAFMQTIGGGYDNQMDSAYPSGILCGAHNRINLTSRATTYSSITYTPTTDTNHVAILSGTYNTLQDGAYATIAGGTTNYMGIYFSGQINTNGSTIGGGSYNYVGWQNTVIGGGVGNTITHSAGAMCGGNFNSIHGNNSVIGGGTRCAIQMGTTSFVGGGQRSLIQTAASPYTYYVELGTQSSGTWLLYYSGSATSALAYNASAGTVQTELEAIVGVGNVTVSGSAGGPYLIKLASGVVSGFMTGNGNNLGSRTTFNFSYGQRYLLSFGGATGGSARLSYGRKALADQYGVSVTGDIAYNAGASTVQSELEALYSVGAGKVTVSGASGGPYTINFDADLVPNGFGLFGNFLGLTGGTGGVITSGSDPNYSVICGGYYNSLRAPFCFIGGGRANDTSAQFSTIPGGCSNMISNTSSSFATISGGGNNLIGNIAAAQSASVGGGTFNVINATAGTIAGGVNGIVNGAQGSIGGGSTNTVSNQYGTVPGGFTNTVSADYGTVMGGRDGTASGQFASVLGGRNNTASGNYAVALGRQATASLYGELAFTALDGSLTAGTRQTRIFHYLRTTTNNTASTMTLDNSSLRAVLPDNSAWTFSGKVTAFRTDVVGDHDGWTFDGLIFRGANAASTALDAAVTPTQKGSTGWTLTVTADTTNGALQLQVTGETGKTIAWIGEVWALQSS